MSITTHQSLLFIQSYMLETFGPHYPRELSWLIGTIYNDLIIPQIFCGDDFTFVINRNNELYSCGDNRFGQLGLDKENKVPSIEDIYFGKPDNRNTFTKVNIPTTRCEQSSHQQRILDPNVLAVSCGTYHTMIITKNNELYSCGISVYGKLCLRDTNKRDIFAKVNISNVLSVTNGGNHIMILTKNNELYSCGSNNFGQLGLGDNDNRNTFAKVNISNVLSVTSGTYHTMIITENNELYACGSNQYGQLGLGDNNNRKTFTKVDILNHSGFFESTVDRRSKCFNSYMWRISYNDNNEG
jgi:alpha-tubulin suppressor-like RCC1 family protein